MRLPINGKELLDARRNRKRPAGVVLLTDSKMIYADCQLIISPPFAYDFSMLRGLDVFFALETDALADRFVAYKKWLDSTLEDVAINCHELYFIPSKYYWGNK